MMQLLVIVLNKLECLDKLLTALEEEHIPGATILDSRGMAQQLEGHDELRFLGSLRYGSYAGLRCAGSGYWSGGAAWYFVSRLSATGRSRG